MPKVIKKKVTKKPTSEIEVKGVVSKLKEFAGQKKGVFLAVIGLIIMSSVAIAGFLIYNSTTKNKAEKLWYEGYKAYYGLYLKQPVAKEERYPKALELFKKAYDTKKSPVYLFYIANCYYEMDKYEDALNALKELNQRFPDNDKFVPLSYHKIAMVSLKKGNAEESLKYLDMLYGYKTGAYRDLSLIESGRILEAMGKTEEAKKKYEEVTKDFPQSPFAEEARARIDRKES